MAKPNPEAKPYDARTEEEHKQVREQEQARDRESLKRNIHPALHGAFGLADEGSEHIV